ncbi:MAG: hypothetical protein AB8I08_28415 [Sandaracinaceae bacterium]
MLRKTLLLTIVLGLPLAACDGSSPTPDAGAMDAGRSDAGETRDSGPTCSDTLCGSDCADLERSEAHCGACDARCDADEVCSAGTCSAPEVCADERVDCGDGCTDLMADEDHCSACDTACASGEACEEGECVSACEASETACDVGLSTVCVDTDTDADHCGACETPCGLGQVCAGGRCECPEGTTMCGDACVDTNTDPLHCGECTTLCTAGLFCEAGDCTCGSGLTECDTGCQNLTVDDSHCGSCGRACSDTQTCVLGDCVSTGVCGEGTVDCGGTCVNLTRSAMHCGACGQACGADGACTDGRCVPRNDRREDAIELTFGDGEVTVTGSNRNADRDGPSAACEANGPNVWYRFTIGERQPVWIDTAGSDYDTAVFLTDSDGDALFGWCNDDCPCGTAGDFTAGTQSCDYGILNPGTYTISVGGYRTAAVGNFTLHVQRLAPVGRLMESRLEGLNEYGSRVRLQGDSESDGSCAAASMSSGEDQYWFVACGDDRPHLFSVCDADDDALLFDPHWDRSYNGRVFDPVMYVRDARSSTELACNDNGGVDFDCFDTSNGANTGSRLQDVTAQRGLNTLIMDSRTGGSGMRYRIRYDVPTLRP